MNQMNFKADKSWVMIFALFFFMPPLAIVALIAKVLYMVYKGQDSENSPSVSSTYDRRPVNKDMSTYEAGRTEMSLSDVEEDLKDAFSEWKESKDVRVDFQPYDHRKDTFSMDSYTEKGLTVEINADIPHGMDGSIKEDADLKEAISSNPLETEHLEDHLNASLQELKVAAPAEVDTDIDLTFSDVHIDTEITFEDAPEDHDHRGETPLKVSTCTMCGTENRIYIIDKFETPTCEKCGMLLIDRN